MIISRDTIQALMPNQTLTKIQGEPTHTAIRKFKKELGANFIAIPCSWGVNKGHLGELQDPATFLACNGTAYTPPPPALPEYPIIPPRAATAECKRLRAKNETAQNKWPTL